jgi:hypothetical protein
LGIFHLPKLKIITIGNLSVKPPQRSDLNQLASLILGAIHNYKRFLIKWRVYPLVSSKGEP